MLLTRSVLSSSDPSSPRSPPSGLRLGLSKRVELACDVARGMACLHAQRPAIIHRDLKPANLLVSGRFEVKVSDFGLSRVKEAAQVRHVYVGLIP